MPDWKRIVRERLEHLRMNGPVEASVSEELSQHLEDRYRDLLIGGASEEEACREVMRDLDDLYPLQSVLKGAQRIPAHECIEGDAGTRSFIDDLQRDFRYAIRMMRKNPVFITFAVLTLALGIGANTTVFTVINTLILNPFPVPDSAGLLEIGGAQAKHSAAPRLLPISYIDFKDYQQQNNSFGSLAGYTNPRGVTWQGKDGSQGIFTELVTSNYFRVLGLTPAIGRFFLPEAERTPGAPAVAVLNYATWKGKFGADPDVIGKTLRLNNVEFTVIGVAPPRFIGVNAIFGPDLWIPATMAERLWPSDMHGVFSDRGKPLFLGVARLTANSTKEQARANLTAIAAGLARAYPEADEGRTAMIRPIRDALFADVSTSSGSILMASGGLLIVVLIVLLIACSNVANLVLARSAARSQEIAIRMAMGANRRRLMRQLLTESVLLGIMSGAVGLFIAYGALNLLFGALPSAANFVQPKLDAAVFLFALFVSLATGFLFGSLPAFKASRASVSEVLKEEARTVGRGRRRVTTANVLLIAQVAFSFLLLSTAALFLQSIARAYRIDPGFQTAQLAVFMTQPAEAGYNEARARSFYKQVSERTASIPGIVSVSWASNLPLWADAQNGLKIEGRAIQSRSEKISTIVNTVDLDYFATAGVRMDRGRAFSRVDEASSIPVAIVNEKLAHDYWPNGEALGRRIQIPGETKMRQIVGVARTGNYSNWGEPPQACVYVPMAQHYSGVMTLYVRTVGNPRAVLTQVQRQIHAAGPEVLIAGVRTGREIIQGGLFFPRTGVALLSVFGLLALALASVGLYGILAYSVNQRKREIGLRMALGAGRATVLRLVLKQGMTLVVTGVLIGFAGALFLGKMLSGMLYGVNPADLTGIAEAAVVLVSIALLACYIPAHRASRVDPLVALHEQ